MCYSGLKYLLKTHYVSDVSNVLRVLKLYKVYKVCHMTISLNFTKVQEISFYCIIACFSLLHVHVHITLLYLHNFLPVTMPGQDGTADPPAKIPTLPFKPPKFDWNASKFYSQFKCFKTKVEFAFKGTYKDNPRHTKVGEILNWLGDAAFEIYVNFIWTAAADKDDPLKVLKAFEDYFKPVQNKYHCWHSPSGIYSSQFKSQSEFMVKLCECVRECSFEKPDEVVKFLFLMHNQNAHVHEELLKSMKDAYGLNDILGYAHLVEGTQHSESLSKAYLDTVKIPNSSVKVDAVVQKKNKYNSKFHGKCYCSKHGSQSKGGGNCCNCGTSHAPKHCPAYCKTCYNCNKKGHFKPLCRSLQCSQSGSRWKGSQSPSMKDQHEISSCDQTDDSS